MPERRLRNVVLGAVALLFACEAAWLALSAGEGSSTVGAPAVPQNPIDAIAALGLPPGALFALVGLAAWGASLAAVRVRWILPQDPSPRAPWSGAVFVGAWLLGVFMSVMLIRIAGAQHLMPFWTDAAGGRKDDAMILAAIAGDTAARILGLALVLWPIWRVGAASALGWRAQSALRQGGGAAVQLVLFLPSFALAYGLSLWIHRGFGVMPAIQPVVARVIQAGLDTPLFWGLAASSVLVAPVWEEALYRGLLYSGLRRTWDLPFSVVLSAAVFAFAHLNALVLLPVFALGVLLALVRERTGSLVAPIAVHAMFNALQLLNMKTYGS